MTDLKVWCLLIDRKQKAAFGDVFDVEVHSGAYIEDLKKKVKEEQLDVLGDVDLAMLTVWRCMNPKLLAEVNMAQLEKNLSNVDLTDETKTEELAAGQEIKSLHLSRSEILLLQLIEVPVSNELRHPVSAENPRLRSDTVQELEGDEYDFIQEQDKVVKTSTQVSAESATESLEVFLRTTTLPFRDVVPTSSAETDKYDTVRASILEKDVPFSAIKFNKMASSMVDNLFTQILPAKPVKNVAPLSRARALAWNYEVVARSPLDHEPSVRRGTHNTLYTCIACLEAVGLMFKMGTEKLNKRANVKMDSVAVTMTTGAGLAVEDKSPKTFEEHCTEENIDALCGDRVLRLQDTEHGFRAIFFKLILMVM